MNHGPLAVRGKTVDTLGQGQGTPSSRTVKAGMALSGEREPEEEPAWTE